MLIQEIQIIMAQQRQLRQSVRNKALGHFSRFILLVASIASLTCNSNNNDNYNFKEIKNESRKILKKYENEKFLVVDVTENEFPELSKLNPEKVTLREEGIYLRMGGKFTNEYGLFIPRDGRPDTDFSASTDPGYTQLEPGIFEYRFK